MTATLEGAGEMSNPDSPSGGGWFGEIPGIFRLLPEASRHNRPARHALGAATSDWQGSSEVEQRTHKPLVAGSIPAPATSLGPGGGGGGSGWRFGPAGKRRQGDQAAGERWRSEGNRTNGSYRTYGSISCAPECRSWGSEDGWGGGLPSGAVQNSRVRRSLTPNRSHKSHRSYALCSAFSPSHSLPHQHFPAGPHRHHAPRRLHPPSCSPPNPRFPAGPLRQPTPPSIPLNPLKISLY